MTTVGGDTYTSDWYSFILLCVAADFGVNDGGRAVGDKGERQAAFLNFLGLQDPAVIDREGVYYSRDFESPDGASVKIIFLDTRFHRDTHYVRSLGELHFPFTALISAFIRLSLATLGIGRDHDGDVLGVHQWIWLESLLRGSTADVHVVVSSIQVATSNPVVESWGHFPKAKKRLLEIFQKYDPSGLLLISGDVHHGEVSSIPYLRAGGTVGQWYEITSSGLTHSCRDSKLTEYICPIMLHTFNAHRDAINNFLMERNFGLLSISAIGVPVENGLRYRAVVNATVSSLESSRRLEQIIHTSAERGSPITQIHDVSFSHVFESDVFSSRLCLSLFWAFLAGIVLYRMFPRHRGSR